MNHFHNLKYERNNSLSKFSTTLRQRRGTRESSENETRICLLEKSIIQLHRFITPNYQVISKDSGLTSAFNSWLMACDYMLKEIKTIECRSSEGTLFRTSIFIRYSNDRCVKSLGQSSVMNLSKIYAIQNLITKLYESLPIEQDDTDTQGIPTQESTKENNTIITRDAGITERCEKVTPILRLMDLSSSEPTHSFQTVLNRWMPMEPVIITTEMTIDSVVKAWNLPASLFQGKKNCAPNLMPFETFIYGNMDIELLFMVNATKFHMGKVLVDIKNDSYMAETIRVSTLSAIARNHIILDLTANAQGNLSVPFKYHRSYVRNVVHENSTKGTSASQYATVTMSILSPLSCISEQPRSIEIRPMYRFKRADFAGMSYRVQTQMDVATVALGSLALKPVLNSAEKLLDRFGKVMNQDKPIDQRVNIVVPRPRMNFSHGVGLSDAVSLTLNPAATTTFMDEHVYDDEPKTVLDLARIWGLQYKSMWSANQEAGSVIFNIKGTPNSRAASQNETIAIWKGVPTPFEYVSSMYNFYSGPYEYRFDFVSNSFYTGAVAITAEFGRLSEPGDECQSYATYTKVFHLGEQRSVNFVVPYIYDTVWRRTGFQAYSDVSNPEIRLQTTPFITIDPVCYTRIKMTVINKLIPVSTVPNQIQVLAFVRASPNYHLHGLIMPNMLNDEPARIIDDFPTKYEYTVPKPSEKTRITRSVEPNEDENGVTEGDKKNKNLPINIRSRFGAVDLSSMVGKTAAEISTIVYSQMDEGLQDDQDPTVTFSIGKSASRVQSSDSQLRIKDILRRPILLMKTQKILAYGPVGQETSNVFMIPVMPPSHMMAAKDAKTNHGFAPLVQRSPHVALVNLFRFWRGKNRYMINVLSKTNQAVYVSYIPHSGARVVGNQFLKSQQLTVHKGSSVASIGLATEMIIPSINPTGIFETPFDSENNWCLTWDEDAERNYSWRDKGDTNCGHLVIYCVDSITVDVWWAAGDDFELANFYGIPICKNPFQVMYNDNAPNYEQSDNNTFNLELYKLRNEIGELREQTQILLTKFNKLSEEQKNMNHKLAVEIRVIHKILKAKIPLEVSQLRKARAHVVFLELTIDELLDDFYLHNYPIEQIDDSTNEEDFQDCNPEDVNSVGYLQSLSSTYNRYKDTIHAAALSCVPVIGPQLAITTTVANMKPKVDSLLEKLNYLSDKTSSSIGDIAGMVKTLVDNVIGSFSFIRRGIDLATSLFDFIIDLLILIQNQNVNTLALTLVRFLVKLGVASAEVVFQFSDRLGDVFKKIFDTTPTEQNSGVESNENLQNVVSGLLVGLVGTMVGVKIDKLPTKTYSQALFTRITSSGGIGYFNQCILLFKNIFQILKDAIMYVMGYVNPEAQALTLLSGKSTIIEKFVSESQLMLNEANQTLINQPIFKRRFWINVMQAYQIQSLLINAPENKVSPLLVKLCTDVIKAGREKFSDLSSSPVRYEPFVICIEGGTTIGKSYAAQAFVTAMLKKSGFQGNVSDVVYVRTPGQKFWSGYKDQPVVQYDDWLNLITTEHINQQIAELYQLKSTAIFIPEMAHLEDKRMKANPKIVVLLCNGAFPRVSVNTVALYPEAVYRRRDVVLRASLNPYYEGRNLRDLSEFESTRFTHLRFQKYEDVKDPNSLIPGLANYTDTVEYVGELFKRYDLQERNNVTRRIKMLQELFGNMDQKYANLEDPFSLFYSASLEIQNNGPSQNGWLPSEVLDAEISALARVLEPLNNTENTNVARHIIPDMPVSPFEQFDWMVYPRVWEKISEYINSGVRYLHGALCNRVYDVYECSICLENKVPYGYCRNGLEVYKNSKEEAALHIICEGCAEHVFNLRCQKCRVGDYGRLIDQNLLQDFLKMSALAKLGVRSCEYLHRFINFCNQYLYQSWKVLNLLKVIQDLASGNYNGMFYTIERTMADITIRSAMDLFPQPQMNIEDIPPVVEYIETYPMEFNEALFEKSGRNIVKSTIINLCMHQQLLDNVDITRYVRGKWLVPDGDVFSHVIDAPCSENCPFMNRTKRREFAEKYFENYKYRTLNLIKSIQREEFRLPQLYDSVPPFLIPSWFAGDVNHDNYRIKELTQIDWYENYIDHDNLVYLLKVIGFASVALGSLYGLSKIYRYFVPTTLEQITPSGDSITRHFKSRIDRVNRSSFVKVQNDGGVVSTTMQKVAKNYFTIVVIRDGKGNRMLSGCGIYGRIGIMPRHYLRKMREWNKELNVSFAISPSIYPNELNQYVFDEIDFVESDTADICLFRLPASCNMFKDIRKYIATDEDFSKVMSPDGMLLRVPSSRHEFIQQINIELYGKQTSEIIRTAEGSCFESLDSMTYNYSSNGACGSLVFRDRHTRPIVAMHYAGSGEGFNGKGYGVILTQEMFEELNIKGPFEQVDLDLGPISDSKVFFNENVNVNYQGSVEPSKVPYIPEKSKIIPSVVQGVVDYPVHTQPCILSKRDPRYTHSISPLVAGCEKHGKLTIDFKTSDLEKVGDALYDGWLSKLKPLIISPQRLSINEAICGFKEVEFYDPMKLDTSAGFPYCTMGKPQKKDWMEVERDEGLYPISVKLDPLILNRLTETEELRNSGRAVDTIFIDYTKDERKNLKKLYSLGGTRIFCMSPIDYTISTRRDTLHFTAAYQKYRNDLMHAVGIAVNGPEWGHLVKSLFNKGSKIVTLDYANFGPGFNAGMAQVAKNGMIKWIMENVANVNENEVRAIFEESINSLHLCNNLIYKQKAGSPSGSPFTVIINSEVNKGYILMAWMKLMNSKVGEASLFDEFKRCVQLVVYGDDLIMSVSDEYAEFFNGVTIQNFFKTHGIVSTDATKSATMIKYDIIENSQFLKCGFKKHPYHRGEWLAPLDFSSVTDTCQWIWESPNKNIATRENCEASLRNAYGHGPEIFDEHKKKINQALLKCKLEPILLTWDDLDRIYFPSYY